MEFDGEVSNFNIYDGMHYPDDVLALSFIDVIEPLTTKYFEITNLESLALVFHRNMFVHATQMLSKKFVVDKQVLEITAHMDKQRKVRYENQILKLPDSNSKCFPYIVQSPTLELKTLPEHLKHAYLREQETLLVIISHKL
uniref:Uncharacterized protein n=1 Tax=Lactuca sativa TaxID=4236 RepID=A0A9R1UG32_LACSA|nr:hypothetical protein LSAT_V11C900458330 [Lactuca sativa]